MSKGEGIDKAEEYRLAFAAIQWELRLDFTPEQRGQDENARHILATRAYTPAGKRWPTLVLSLYADMARPLDTPHTAFQVVSAMKRGPSQWWENCAIPISLASDLCGMLKLQVPPPPRKKVSAGIRKVISWREARSDHCGEDLLLTVRSSLVRWPIEKFPEEHREAVLEFKAMTKEEQWETLVAVGSLG